MQQQLRELNLDEPAFTQRPALLGAQPETLEYEHCNSAREDTKEDEGGTTSALNAKLDTSTGEEMDAAGYPALTLSADRCLQRNRALRRERNQWEFCRPKHRRLSFPLF